MYVDSMRTERSQLSELQGRMTKNNFVEAHHAAVGKIVRERGGLDKLGLDGIIARSVLR